VRFGYSFATWRFHQKGVGIRGAHDVGWIADLNVGRMMNADPVVVPASASLVRLRELVPFGRAPRVFAVDADGGFVGSIDVAHIHDPDLDEAAAGLVAYDLASDRNGFLLPSQNIRVALNRFTELEVEMLPVLASSDSPKVVGYLTEAFALRRYAEELERHRSAELGQRELFNVGATSID
jgi:CIC family chloride channel protein